MERKPIDCFASSRPDNRWLVEWEWTRMSQSNNFNCQVNLSFQLFNTRKKSIIFMLGENVHHSWKRITLQLNCSIICFDDYFVNCYLPSILTLIFVKGQPLNGSLITIRSRKGKILIQFFFFGIRMCVNLL